METMFYWSMALNGILLLTIVWLLHSGQFSTKAEASAENKMRTAKNEVYRAEQENRVSNEVLYALGQECETKLPEQYRGFIKILIEKERPQYPAILQVGDLKINLRREGASCSVLQADFCVDAVSMACYGYEGTGRYIPVPTELEYIMTYKDIINVYLQALGLEQISADDNFWTLDVETGWNSGWKRFNWSVATACEKLKNKFLLRTAAGYKNANESKGAKLILLLKGWDHLFVEA